MFQFCPGPEGKTFRPNPGFMHTGTDRNHPGDSADKVLDIYPNNDSARQPDRRFGGCGPDNCPDSSSTDNRSGSSGTDNRSGGSSTNNRPGAAILTTAPAQQYEQPLRQQPSGQPDPLLIPELCSSASPQDKCRELSLQDLPGNRGAKPAARVSAPEQQTRGHELLLKRRKQV